MVDVEDTILIIEEVAQYLKVSEQTVSEWAQNGEIPAGKIGTEWRFKRSDIEKWINDRFIPNPPPVPIQIESLIVPERIVLLEQNTKREALTALVDVVSRAPQIKNRQELLEEILKREELMSTAVGRGVAIPHVRLFSITDLVLTIGINREGITDFQALDEEPVHLLFMIVAAYTQHTFYLQTLAFFNKRLKNAELRESLIKAPTSRDAYRILIESKTADMKR
ncbi:PTS fructose transporter subunit IIA [Spirochaetia bacterium]|nr:PTS fructose transporter subunit IIA [Spirochaetia bacterium]